MAIPLTINGQVFEYPENFDENWGVNATGWAQAVTNGMLQRTGGNFPLLAQVDFGPNFGIKVKSIVSETVNPASSGYIALAKTDTINWRNNANSGNLLLGINGSDLLTFNGVALGTTSLTDNHIYVGNASNVPTDVAMSGDATIVASGALTIANGAITDAKVNATAAIALTKLAAQTINTAAVFNGSGFLAPSATTSAQIGFLSTTTSDVQTQLNSKLALAGGTMSGAINMGSNKITSLAAGTTTTDAVNFGQIYYGFQAPVQSTATTSTNTTSATYVSTNLSASITPTSASHRIKITVSAALGGSNTTTAAVASIFRGSTDLSGGAAGGFSQVVASSTGGIDVPVAVAYIDSPATTSATTYTVKILSNNGNNAQFGGGSLQVIILEEIV